MSYALGKYGARVLDAPLPSGSFRSWGKRGKGKWMTVYADSGHVFIVIAGLRLDTSQTAGAGPGWSKDVRAGLRERLAAHRPPLAQALTAGDNRLSDRKRAWPGRAFCFV